MTKTTRIQGSPKPRVPQTTGLEIPEAWGPKNIAAIFHPRKKIAIAITKKKSPRSLTLRSLFFSISLLFSDFPCSFVRFAFFRRILWVPAKRKTLAFFGASLAFFQKKQGLGRSGLGALSIPHIRGKHMPRTTLQLLPNLASPTLHQAQGCCNRLSCSPVADLPCLRFQATLRRTGLLCG